MNNKMFLVCLSGILYSDLNSAVAGGVESIAEKIKNDGGRTVASEPTITPITTEYKVCVVDSDGNQYCRDIRAVDPYPDLKTYLTKQIKYMLKDVQIVGEPTIIPITTGYKVSILDNEGKPHYRIIKIYDVCTIENAPQVVVSED